MQVLHWIDINAAQAMLNNPQKLNNSAASQLAHKQLQPLSAFKVAWSHAMNVSEKTSVNTSKDLIR